MIVDHGVVGDDWIIRTSTCACSPPHHAQQHAQTQEPVQQYLASGGASAVVKQMFTETYLRRLATLPAGDNEEQL